MAACVRKVNKTSIYPVLAVISANPTALIVPWSGFERVGVGFVDGDCPEADRRLLSWTELSTIVSQPSDAISLALNNHLNKKGDITYTPIGKGLHMCSFTDLSAAPPAECLSASTLRVALFRQYTALVGGGPAVFFSVPRRDVVLIGSNMDELRSWTRRFSETGTLVSQMIYAAKILDRDGGPRVRIIEVGMEGVGRQVALAPVGAQSRH